MLRQLQSQLLKRELSAKQPLKYQSISEIAEIEAQRRANSEMKALKDAEDMKVLDSLNYSDARCRMNTIKEIEAVTNSFDKSYKIGEGGGQSSSVPLIIYLFQLKFSFQMQLKEDQVSARSEREKNATFFKPCTVDFVTHKGHCLYQSTN